MTHQRDSQQRNDEKNGLLHCILVTGLSGAGKTSVMRALEDLDYYCVDNLPLPLIPQFLSFILSQQPRQRRIALGIDARSYLSHEMAELAYLKESQQCRLDVIFVTSSESTLLRRFQETRRKHPLEKGCTLLEAIETERRLLALLIDNADIVLNTDRFTIHEVRRWVIETFLNRNDREMVVNVVSFGFKHGVPAESNFVYDVRSLPNPYFIPELKPMSGRDQPIVDYLFAQPAVVEYWSNLSSFIQFSLQKSFEEGRFFVTVAIGCTGGRHRSVAFAERVAQQSSHNLRFIVTHRDIGR